jgi:hypothetical protein
MCQNIRRSRAAVSPDVINCYFDELKKELKDVPPSNIVNYDETNVCDDPGRRKLIFRRGCKYLERVMNLSKASMSVKFATSADGTILPPYAVYKAVHLYDIWRELGSRNARYNKTKSGWFDTFCFVDCVQSIAIPYFRNLGGSKVLIGDNLASHLSTDIIKTCNDNNIRFIFLRGNSTHNATLRHRLLPTDEDDMAQDIGMETRTWKNGLSRAKRQVSCFTQKVL